jgi:hypothetical protein
MALTMENIIFNAAKKNPNQLVRMQISDNQKYYFFFRDELNIAPIVSGNVQQDLRNFRELKRTTLRHAIPNKGKFYDYIVDRHYNTLQEWATANGKTIDDIVYGVNHIHFGQDGNQDYIPLNTLVKALNPNWISPTENRQQVTIPKQTSMKDHIIDLRKTIAAIEDSVTLLYTIVNHMETM